MVRFQMGGDSAKKTACNIAPVGSGYNQLQIASSLRSGAMAKLIMWNLMTLDGFVEGPNRDISWHSDVWGEELEQLSIEQLNAAGGLLFGRVTYELMASHWPRATGAVADFMNAAPKYVFSRTVKESDWNNTRMFGDDVSGTVARLKRDSAKDIFLFGSADLASHLIPHGLIDEFRIAVNPVILGGGTPLFKHGEKVRLKLIDSRPLTTGIVILRYVPAPAE
jgi:dihydrofolate reductase